MKKLVGGKNGTRVARGSTPAAWAFVLGALLVTASAWADDYTVTSAGEVGFTGGSIYDGRLINKANDGTVTFKSVGEAESITFTGFDAPATGAKTVFDGGWWDFNKASDAHVNFFTNTATYSSRTTILTNGAQIVGVGAAWIAGLSGTDNTLELGGLSSMSVASLTLGSMASQQRSKVTVSGGSTFECSGNLFMTRASVSSENGGKNLTGNEFSVSGTGSSLTVGGRLNIGGSRLDNGSWNSTFGLVGGNFFEVTDDATATLAAVQVSGSARMGQRNHIRFGKDARVDMTSFSISTSGASGYCAASNLVEVLDGAVVTNTGSFTFGSTANSACGYNTLVVSNAEFTTANPSVINKVNYLLCGPHSEIRLSGSDAKFKVTNGFSALFKGDYCRFVCENYCNYTMPVEKFSYTLDCNDERIVVRDHARITTGNFATCKDKNASNCFRDVIEVSDDGEFYVSTGGATLQLKGNFCGLEVSNGTVNVANSFYVGVADDDTTNGSSSNCYVRIAGSHPYIRSGWSTTFYTNTELRVELPKTGYDEGYATSSKPLMKFGSSSGHKLNMTCNSKFVLDGVDDFVQYHYAQGKKGSYYLFYGEDFSAHATNCFAEVGATLPPEATFVCHIKGGSSYLRLDIKPKFGMVLLVK